MRGKKSSFAGRWRIIEMDAWDSDYMDMEVEAYLKIEGNGAGEFQFGLVHGCIDGHFTTRDGKSAVEFSWEGNDEMDPASGRGWVMLEDENTLKGMMFFHQGDKSVFVAKRKKSGKG